MQYPSFRSTRTVSLPRAPQCLVVSDTVVAGTERDQMEGRRSGPRRTTGGIARSVMVWNVGGCVRKLVPAPDNGPTRWRCTLITARRRAYTLTLTTVPSDAIARVDVRLARGEGAPMLGWYSPRHGEFRPSTAIVLEITGSAVIETRVEPAPRGVGRRGH